MQALPASKPVAADVVIVLGGGDSSRYRKGVELVEQGFANTLVLIQPHASELKDAKSRVGRIKVWNEVYPGNTWGEAGMGRVQMQANGWRKALVVSDPPHLLRVQYAWWSQLWGAGLDFALVASEPDWWSAWRWWSNPKAASFVGDEFLKLGYYVLRYRFGVLASS